MYTDTLVSIMKITHTHTTTDRSYSRVCVSDAIKFNQSPQQSDNLWQYAKNILRLQTATDRERDRIGNMIVNRSLCGFKTPILICLLLLISDLSSRDGVEAQSG